MYIFELITKLFKKKSIKQTSFYNTNEIEDETQDCDHLFLPLDMSEQYLACKYCGLVVKNNSPNR